MSLSVSKAEDFIRESNDNVRPNLNWILKEFDDLSPKEVYAIAQLRIQVFIVEQNCVFQDLDNKDFKCSHLMGWIGDILVACARIIPPGVSYDGYSSIGRIVTSLIIRRTGFGKELLARAISATEKKYANMPIRISAQVYVRKYYELFGFKQTSDIYLEDLIEHIEMTRLCN